MARVEVEIKPADRLVLVVIDAEEAYIRVPHRRRLFADRQPVDGFDDAEHAGQHACFREVLLDLLVGKRKLCRAQFFRGVADVPCFERRHVQFGARECLEFVEIALRERLRLDAQIFQKLHDLCRGIRHFRLERVGGVAFEVEQLRQFAAQIDDLGDQRRVVEFRLAEFGGARGAGAVHQLAQCAVVGVLHDRQVGRRMQRKFPAGLAVFFRGVARRFDVVVRNALEFCVVSDEMGKPVGGVEHIV